MFLFTSDAILDYPAKNALRDFDWLILPNVISERGSAIHVTPKSAVRDPAHLHIRS
jgi:hypothetical protein